jgi:hypothetical protein
LPDIQEAFLTQRNVGTVPEEKIAMLSVCRPGDAHSFGLAHLT